MITKVLRRAVAPVATTALLAAPLAVAGGTSFVPVACGDPTVATTTQIAIDKTDVQYGERVFGTARVEAVGGGQRPTGDVHIEVLGQVIFIKRLNQGVATKLLPRGLDAGRSYSVRASYDGVCPWGESVSGTTAYTITKATSTPRPRVLKARGAVFRTTVAGGGGLPAKAGRVEFQVRKRGVVLRSGVDFLRNGVAQVDLPNLRRGRYALRVLYDGNTNYEAGQRTIRFRVR